VLIDSISPRRAPTAGRPNEAEQMSKAEWQGFAQRFRDIAKMGAEDFGLTVSLHPHAAGFMDFEAEVEHLLGDVDSSLLKLCLDTGHSHYAGFDPVAFMKRHRDRLAYVHFKDIDPAVKADVVAKRTDFYKACGQGIFCNLGKGMTDFTAVKKLLLDTGYDGWCTVEQDCDPAGSTIPLDDARANRDYLRSIGF
jgi:inosose dehydratase